MPKALRLLADQITAPDHVPSMCLRDAAAMIESLANENDLLRSANDDVRRIAMECDEAIQLLAHLSDNAKVRRIRPKI